MQHLLPPNALGMSAHLLKNVQIFSSSGQSLEIIDCVVLEIDLPDMSGFESVGKVSSTYLSSGDSRHRTYPAL